LSHGFKLHPAIFNNKMIFIITRACRMFPMNADQRSLKFGSGFPFRSEKFSTLNREP
jgi:hypothetical protein